MYTYCYTFMWFFPYICIAECRCTWATSMLLVLMRTSPPRLHVYSRLTILPSFVDGTVYGHLHILPTVTIWLGCPRFRCLASNFEFMHAHVHCYKHYYKHDMIAMTMQMNLTSLFNFTREDRSDPLALNTSVGNASNYFITFKISATNICNRTITMKNG